MSLAESRRWNGKMMTQMKRSPEAAQAWQRLCDLPSRGSSKNAKKRVFLFAWKEGLQQDNVSWGPSFWEEVITLTGEEPWRD